jgi:hypothetical protein
MDDSTKNPRPKTVEATAHKSPPPPMDESTMDESMKNPRPTIVEASTHKSPPPPMDESTKNSRPTTVEEAPTHKKPPPKIPLPPPKIPPFTAPPNPVLQLQKSILKKNPVDKRIDHQALQYGDSAALLLEAMEGVIGMDKFTSLYEGLGAMPEIHLDKILVIHLSNLRKKREAARELNKIIKQATKKRTAVEANVKKEIGATVEFLKDITQASAVTAFKKALKASLGRRDMVDPKQEKYQLANSIVERMVELNQGCSEVKERMVKFAEENPCIFFYEDLKAGWVRGAKQHLIGTKNPQEPTMEMVAQITEKPPMVEQSMLASIEEKLDHFDFVFDTREGAICRELVEELRFALQTDLKFEKNSGAGPHLDVQAALSEKFDHSCDRVAAPIKSSEKRFPIHVNMDAPSPEFRKKAVIFTSTFDNNKIIGAINQAANHDFNTGWGSSSEGAVAALGNPTRVSGTAQEESPIQQDDVDADTAPDATMVEAQQAVVVSAVHGLAILSGTDVTEQALVENHRPPRKRRRLPLGYEPCSTFRQNPDRVTAQKVSIAADTAPGNLTAMADQVVPQENAPVSGIAPGASIAAATATSSCSTAPMAIVVQELNPAHQESSNSSTTQSVASAGAPGNPTAGETGTANEGDPVPRDHFVGARMAQAPAAVKGDQQEKVSVASLGDGDFHQVDQNSHVEEELSQTAVTSSDYHVRASNNAQARQTVLRLCLGKCQAMKPKQDFTEAMWSSGRNCQECYHAYSKGRTMENDIKARPRLINGLWVKYSKTDAQR